MASTLTRQRCWVHLEREAAARCPVCTRFYCRECVTEHEGRVVCAGCLRDLLAATRRRGIGSGGRQALAFLVRGGQLAGSIALTWVFFQLLGHWLLSTANEFHDTSVWQEQFFGGGSSDGGSSVNKDKNDPENDKEKDDGDSKTIKDGKARKARQSDDD